MLESLKKKANILYKRFCHVINENQRVMDMKNLIIKIRKKGKVKDIHLLLVQKIKMNVTLVNIILMIIIINMVNIFKL